MLTLIALYIAIGLLSGLLAGLVGLGGGIVIVPSLTALLIWQHFPNEYLMQVVTGTSLGAIFITMMMSTWSQHQRGAIAWRTLRWFIPSMVLGALLGVCLAKQISTAHLRSGFALFCVGVGIWMLLRAGAEPKSSRFQGVHPAIWLFFGFFAGIVAGLLGVGGGVLLIPIFLLLGFSMPQASANSVACALPTALMGTVTNMALGWGQTHDPQLWGYVYWTAALGIGLASIISAPWGVYLCHRLPVPVIKRVFGGILLIIAWQMWP